MLPLLENVGDFRELCVRIAMRGPMTTQFQV
jgi:hypothetical protein